MSSFTSAAKTLLQTVQPPSRVGNSVSERLDNLAVLSKTGFSVEHVFRDLRELYDDCTDDDKAIKLAIGKLMVQVHGMLKGEEQVKAAPVFVLNIQGDNVRVNSMLCPNFNE